MRVATIIFSIACLSACTTQQENVALDVLGTAAAVADVIDIANGEPPFDAPEHRNWCNQHRDHQHCSADFRPH